MSATNRLLIPGVARVVCLSWSVPAVGVGNHLMQYFVMLVGIQDLVLKAFPSPDCFFPCKVFAVIAYRNKIRIADVIDNE